PLAALLVCLVETIFFESALVEPVQQRLSIRARKMKHLLHIDHVIHDPGLGNVSWNPVQHQRVDVRLELVRFYRRVDRLSPKLHRDIIWHQPAFARILKEGFADFSARVDGAEYIATSAMIVTRDRAESLA